MKLEVRTIYQLTSLYKCCSNIINIFIDGIDLTIGNNKEDINTIVNTIFSSQITIFFHY